MINRLNSLAALAAGAMICGAMSSGAVAGVLTFDFSGAGPYSVSGVTLTPTCALTSGGPGVCSITQNGDGLGISFTNQGLVDNNGEIDGITREEQLVLTLSQSGVLKSILFDAVDNDPADGDQGNVIIGNTVRGQGNLATDTTNAWGITGATLNCEVAGNDNACLLDLSNVSPANFTNSVFRFGDHSSSDLDADDDYRILSISVDVAGVNAPTQVPEPAALSVFGLGLLGMAALRRRHVKA